MGSSLSSRASGLLLGQSAATAHGRAPAPQVRLALAAIMADLLLVPDPDLGELARRWAEVAAGDDGALDAGSRIGFTQLRETGVPRQAPAIGELGSLPVQVIPAALLAFETPRTLTSLSWHLAALTHPDPESTWGAVAINVAASRLVQGHRDFIPDVIEALRNNGAPALLLETVRRLPLLRRENIDGMVTSTQSPAVGCTCAALWVAHTSTRTAGALEWLEQLPVALESAAPAGAALLGARDGFEAMRLAIKGRPVDTAQVQHLADRLARLTLHDQS